ncbi:serine/threonine-protein kinase [Streptomyces violascens]|uniref:non-specific serine/threonine protein kinase n=1 Tax=Streptomyces violascens TaxID=67381 RepID=A0ABQ3R199_9ACTN|nr:serine/threonine-protein kinase [Streptomyces violascens]GGU10645.1 serine/threonine protein kinase [Streptomyces violascens]GHI43306.1 serine/threonine protein kinase [Streptomyces violascens]
MENTHSTNGSGAGLLLAGRYRLGDAIGRGGMGKVWRAHDEVLHRTVAVKELTAALYVAEADRAILHARTQKEARAAARITHPGVVTVHDVLDHDNRPWIVMQYVDGPSLADAVKAADGHRIDAREAARIGLHVLGALRAAHAAGVLHRDVKPGNVLLAGDGRVLLTDFGIAAIEGDVTITKTGELVGSIDYLAPERVQGAHPGPASDLWSLGATLYAAVQGESPFRRDSPISTMQAVVEDEPPAPDRAGALAPVIVALLRKQPEDRPSVEEAERMFLDAMEGRASKGAQAYVPTRQLSERDMRSAAESRTGPTELNAVPRPAPERPAAQTVTRPAPRRRRWRTVALVVVLAAVVGVATGFAYMKYQEGKGGSGGGSAQNSGSPTTTDSSGKPGGDQSVPAGFQRVNDPAGFSMLVPKGWKRQMDGTEIDYTPDNGRHRIRISVDKVPDFENPYMHMLNLEKTLKERLQYKRLTLHSNTFRDQERSSLWEFTYYEKQDFPGKRHAIDQMYYADGGKPEYAIYMSGPDEDWATIRQQFDTVLQSWQPTSSNGG